ncbi:glycosyl hydrolase family protein [Roseomonas nepalensis]|uniref:Glycosyl hydrolase family protein n=1 Tax=Muricoccus nepalensis TaxID=1854500 RepID=A0A502G746_9PROT|nr:family 1 glycosylhydrolase [Roseomonas nepalensis]TPG57678.1 glycosyl hydrolase family protein [Roseomonas nepalensis]
MTRPEVWGGIECTVLRVGDDWRDQLRETGHHHRESDLDLVAALGIRRLRYPVLWERVAPRSLDDCDWSWSDARLARLRRLNIAPILGLVHHGSGPGYTDLLDPAFPEGLAAYAGLVATRYPWVTDWTPVNEPLTTARFSALYAHWHPHGNDQRSFLTALMNECRGTALAMRAIRAVQPRARLVQTEDLGRVFATAPLAGQADYENERRWLSFDLLCGRVDRHHPWHAAFLEAGVAPAHLDELVAEPCAPDVLGINHYVTSDRFLDHRRDLYHPDLSGGAPYADTEAVRVPLPAHLLGPAPRLREVWERYRLPIAVTEVHLGCEDPEESVRWLLEVWNAAVRLREEGAEILAVTPWSLFGAVDWVSLLRRREGAYEPGVFDVRFNPPRPTPLAEVVRALAVEGRFTGPRARQAGWWRRPDRFVVAPEAWQGEARPAA